MSDRKDIHPMKNRLQQIMAFKQSNLCLAADLPTLAEVIELVKQIGQYLCLVKLHADLYPDWSLDRRQQLQKIAEEQNFLLWEDRKFADIRHIVNRQYRDSLYQIDQWAHLVSAHLISGPDSIADIECGVLVILEMSSQPNLYSPELAKTILSWTQQSNQIVGWVCQRSPSRLQLQQANLHRQDYLCVSPGIHLSQTQQLDQRFRTPLQAITDGIDIMVIGRGIIAADDPIQAVQDYHQEALVYFL